MDRAVRRLRAKIAATETDANGHRKFGPELRGEIIEHARTQLASGETQQAIATELCIGPRVLWRWLKRSETTLREVVIEGSEPSTPASARRLVLRNGVEIVGLEIDELIAIARALS